MEIFQVRFLLFIALLILFNINFLPWCGRKGDLSENGSPLVERKGIEIGHCFYLGTKYSKPLDCTFVFIPLLPT
jgi:hypothetical protein